MTNWKTKQPRWSQTEVATGSGTIPPSENLTILIPEGSSVDLQFGGSTVTYPLPGVDFTVGNAINLEDTETISYSINTGSIVVIRRF